MAISRPRASFDAQAMCGVMMQLSRPVSRLPSRGGSVASTSTAAPPTLPLRSASRRAASSTSGPRAVLMRITPSFIFAMVSRLISPLLSARRGQCREITSLRRSSSSMGTTKSSVPCPLAAMTSMPKARASAAVARPI